MSARAYARAMVLPSSPLPKAVPIFLVGLSLLCLRASEVVGQRVNGVSWALVQQVMPAADRFTEAAGDPPVIRGYRTVSGGEEVLAGYVFLTSDLPPEQFGYSGPIEALVGMTPDGTLTGVRVTDYRESRMRTMGDFLSTPGFQEQFAGKSIGDPFRVWGDIEGISRVSITVRALSRGVRDSARRVAAAYGGTPEIEGSEKAATDPVGRSWFELGRLGIVRRIEVTDPGKGSAGISLAHISSDRVGEYFLGAPLYERALRAVERRGGADHLMLYGVDGSRLRLFHQQGWSVEQDGDTTAVDPRGIIMLGIPSGGIASGEATMVGLMLVDDGVDFSRPFTFVYDLGDLGVRTVEYVTQEARRVMAEDAVATAEPEGAVAAPEVGVTEPAVAVTTPEVGATDPEVAPTTPPDGRDLEGESPGESAVQPDVSADGDSSASETVPAAAAAVVDPSEAGAAEGAEAAPRPEVEVVTPGGLQTFDFVVTEDETLWARTLADTSWPRVATMLAVLALATTAFIMKSVTLRWVSLGVTLVVLGFVDGGFLSVSHITSGIWAGPGVYLRDLPLLLMVGFTVVTTFLWGRVFCGFLCPFGALQDIIDRVVPASMQRGLPGPLHDRALGVKYAVLAVIVLPAIAGSHVSLYQYFEPFGTVFFLSPSLFLWAIAGVFLVASAVVPRFYCRYACPLGAALGIVSLISLNRIARVEQCNHCKVCEQKCPTGAIRGPDVNFRECVRCNICEVQLIDRKGVCGHDMAEVRSRLVQLEVRVPVEVADA